MKPRTDEAAATRRQILADHHDIAELTKTIAASPDGTQIAGCVARLQTLLQRHFRSEEDLDGLHASIHVRTPERNAQLSQLRDEHAALLQQVQRLRELADGPAHGDELRRRGAELIRRLQAHEAHENEVFLDSIWHDLGVAD